MNDSPYRAIVKFPMQRMKTWWEDSSSGASILEVVWCTTCCPTVESSASGGTGADSTINEHSERKRCMFCSFPQNWSNEDVLSVSASLGCNGVDDRNSPIVDPAGLQWTWKLILQKVISTSIDPRRSTVTLRPTQKGKDLNTNRPRNPLLRDGHWEYWLEWKRNVSFWMRACTSTQIWSEIGNPFPFYRSTQWSDNYLTK